MTADSNREEEAESKSTFERIWETSAWWASAAAFALFAPLSLHFFDYVRKILTCRCNEMRALDHADFLVLLVTFWNLYASFIAIVFFGVRTASYMDGFHSDAPNDIFDVIFDVLFGVDCALNFLSGVCMFLWFSKESSYVRERSWRERRPKERSITLPVAAVGINAATWYALVIAVGFSESFREADDFGVWILRLIIPAVVDTALVYILYRHKMEQSASAVGTPEEPLAHGENDDDDEMAQPTTVEIV